MPERSPAAIRGSPVAASAAWPLTHPTAGTHRLLAGSLQTAATGYGTVVFKEAHEVACFRTQLNWEDEFMRNLAFSLMLVALAVLQIAVVTVELTHSGAPQLLAANHAQGKTSSM